MESRRKSVLKGVTALFISVMLCCAGLVSQVLAQDFTADMSSRYGKETMNAKIFVSGDKMRMEMQGSIMIIRSDKGVTWMVMPSEKMYMEQPIDARRTPWTATNFNGETARVSMGQETVNGQPAEKFQVTYTDNGKTETVYQWLNSNQMPVKVEAVDGSFSTEYKNIATGAQAADLFEVPADYQKIALPSLGMGM